ncbi:MAG: HEAT repeat domain-containing protein, partial [Armatimonadetes bacterium]|nr:HEAT repeat domain-containing protein [Anaerolineae bacterium]
MIDAALLKQLTHANPEIRKQAITAIAKTKDPAALSHLANVYRTDQVVEVRELARKAGVYIKKHADAEPSYQDEDDLAPADDVTDDDAPVKAKRGQVAVSASNEERAAGLVKQALDLHMRGDNDRATKYLKDAFKKNPNLEFDSYTTGLATTITGLSTDQAIGVMVGELDVDGTPPSKAKGKRGVTDGDEPGWGAALVDLLIYTLVNMGLVGLGLLAFVVVFIPLLTEALLTQAAASGSFGSSS